MRIAVVAFSLLLSSCSVLLPYHENKLCERGIDGGVCGRISAVYRDTVRYPEKYLGDSCKICTEDMSLAMYELSGSEHREYARENCPVCLRGQMESRVSEKTNRGGERK